MSPMASTKASISSASQSSSPTKLTFLAMYLQIAILWATTFPFSSYNGSWPKGGLRAVKKYRYPSSCGYILHRVVQNMEQTKLKLLSLYWGFEDRERYRNRRFDRAKPHDKNFGLKTVHKQANFYGNCSNVVHVANAATVTNFNLWKRFGYIRTNPLATLNYSTCGLRTKSKW